MQAATTACSLHQLPFQVASTMPREVPVLRAPVVSCNMLHRLRRFVAETTQSLWAATCCMPGCDQLKMARLPEFGILARSMRLLRMVYSCLHSGSRTQQVITTRTTGLDASTPADRRIATNESPITIEYLCEYPRGVSCVHMACGAMSGGARIHAVWPLSSVARRNRLMPNCCLVVCWEY